MRQQAAFDKMPGGAEGIDDIGPIGRPGIPPQERREWQQFAGVGQSGIPAHRLG